MTWWPFSSGSVDAKAQPQSQPQTLSQSAPQLQPHEALSGSVPHSIPPSSSASSPPTHPDTAPHDHDPDFYAAPPHLAPPSFSTTTNSSTQTPSPSPFPSNENDELDPHLPRTMSCRAAFDSAFYCSSLGGHFNDIYRYGQLRSCSDHWNDFWFCMRVKNSYSGRDVKERMVQERYREKEDKLRKGPSSEDVWRLRGEDERVVGAFGMGKRES
ncbi:hypothetical protein HBI88_193760 [Parastagonospora nodorum]|nr:hypothetical protein HBI89_192840 [Parastagonospora nodorum]KAH5909847.1 hypothetical protein HBI88_193760 [Parastagonospora nodorum]KAH5931302.1 hypothetical protein HBI87_188190 [Parastagonospora nodorum]